MVHSAVLKTLKREKDCSVARFEIYSEIFLQEKMDLMKLPETFGFEKKWKNSSKDSPPRRALSAHGSPRGRGESQDWLGFYHRWMEDQESFQSLRCNWYQLNLWTWNPSPQSRIEALKVKPLIDIDSLACGWKWMFSPISEALRRVTIQAFKSCTMGRMSQETSKEWRVEDVEVFMFSSCWTGFSWYVRLGWNNPRHSTAMIIPCCSGEWFLRLQSKSALAMKPLRRQLLVAVHGSRMRWVHSDVSRFLHGSGCCCFCWNGRNLFHHQPPSTFWCFVSLHFLTSWTLGPRHLNRTLQPEYVYIYNSITYIIYTYYPPMCGGELLSFHWTSWLPGRWLANFGPYLIPRNLHSFTFWKYIHRDQRDSTRITGFGQIQPLRFFPRFPQRLGSRRTSGLQSDHNERRRSWLQWMGYIWIMFSVGIFFESSYISRVFAILRYITCWKPLLVFGMVNFGLVCRFPCAFCTKSYQTQGASAFLKQDLKTKNHQGGWVSMKMFPEIKSPLSFLHGEFQQL